MRRALAQIDRWLLHPWTSRLGAVQAVIAAAMLAAGLVGGAVTLVFGFALGWALLSAVGAGLLAMGGVATLLERRRTTTVLTARGAAQELAMNAAAVDARKAAGWILDDLKRAQTVLLHGLERGVWWQPTDRLDFIGWSEYGEALTAAGLADEHRLVRQAVIAVDRVRDTGKARWESWLDSGQALPPPLAGLDRDGLEHAVDTGRRR